MLLSVIVWSMVLDIKVMVYFSVHFFVFQVIVAASLFDLMMPMFRLSVGFACLEQISILRSLLSV